MVYNWLHLRCINPNVRAAQTIPGREMFAWLATYTRSILVAEGACMMNRWRVSFLGLLLTGLVACGSATTTTSNQSLDDSTPTTAAAGGAAAAPTSSTPQARSTPSAPVAGTAPASAPATPQPNGTLPTGWQVYRGPADFPFVIAYPPDWTVDDSQFPEQSVIYINGPSGNDTVEIVGSAQQSGANIDVLRDEFFNDKTAFCDKKGIESTSTRQISGVPFSILGATCDESDELSYLLVASGVKDGDEWSFAMRTLYARKDVVVKDIFDPMLASLNIYALLPH
jgi:hypothetical protein